MVQDRSYHDICVIEQTGGVMDGQRFVLRQKQNFTCGNKLKQTLTRAGG